MKHPELLTGSKTIRLPEDPDHEYYIPGYLLQKVGFALLTLCIVGIALIDMIPKLWIMATGTSTYAEVVEVIRTEPDRTETIFRNDARARESFDDENRAPIFYNTLAYRLEDDSRVMTRLQRGSRLKAPFNILDDSGLPNTVLIAYRPANPENILIPMSLSTWFLPVMIMMFGLSGLVVAILFLVRASTPIQVPNLGVTEERRQEEPGAIKAEKEQE